MNILENTMSLRWVIHIYECDEMYLYEIIEDYKLAKSQEEKDEIFNSFCSSIWSSSNKRRTYTKTINFNVRKDLLGTELGQVFNTWSEVEYKYYKSMTKNENWCSFIRQKINNIYTRYFDKEIILGKQYMDLIKTPKRLYYEWISGIDMDASTVTDLIDDAIVESENVKKRLQMKKMSLSWNDYKKIIEGFLHKCFENCKLIEEYEDKKCISNRFDFLTEDHFYVGYVNRCLDGEIRKWQKRQYNIPQSSRNGYRRCKQCGDLYIVKSKYDRCSKYCNECAHKMKLKQVNECKKRAINKLE